MGKIQIDHTGSGGGITLSSDGTSLLLDGTAIGGLELYAENPSSPTAPSATGSNAVAIGDSADASGIRSIALGYNPTASATTSTAIGRGSVASAQNATAIGNGSTDTAGPVAAGTAATSLGRSYASGTDSFAAAIGNNTSSYGALTSNSVAMGGTAKTSGSALLAIGNSAIANGAQNIAIGGLAVASATSSMALGYGTDATGSFSTAVGRNAQATATSANAFGRDAISNGSQATAIGDAYASGADSFAAAITNNTSSYGAVAGNSIVIGRNSKATAGYNYGIAIGNTNTVQASESYCFGANCTVTQTRSLAIGNRATVYSEGKMAFASSRFAANGDGQAGTFVLMRSTTDATAATLATANSTPNANNQVALPNNSAYAFHGTIVARQQASGGTACAAWKIEGLIRREANAGTTTLVNSATTVLDNTPSWGMALSADTTNGCLKIEVTGAAATNIRWVATIHTSEVTYA